MSENDLKTVFFVYSSKLGDMQTLVDSQRGTLNSSCLVYFLHFLKLSVIFWFISLKKMFFLDFRRKLTEKCLNRLKKVETAEKSVSTSFWVCTAPESWLKYTATLNAK